MWNGSQGFCDDKTCVSWDGGCISGACSGSIQSSAHQGVNSSSQVAYNNKCYKVKNGHRQYLTKLEILKIDAKAPAAKKAAPKKEAKPANEKAAVKKTVAKKPVAKKASAKKPTAKKAE
jgi:hypothetical protein